MIRAFVCGCAGLELTADERSFLAASAPWGLILFKRNVGSRQQLLTLVSDFRDSVGRPDAPVLIDQEGGRVQRMGPPHWQAFPSASAYGALAGADHGARCAGRGTRRPAHRPRSRRGRHHHRLCPGARPSGPRQQRRRRQPRLCARPQHCRAAGARIRGRPAGRRRASGRQAHPGSRTGRGGQPFHGAGRHRGPRRRCRAISRRSELLADLPMAMTAHVVYTAVDPERPGTISPIVIDRIVRGMIGFQGLLFTDDLSMQALQGTLGAARRGRLRRGLRHRPPLQRQAGRSERRSRMPRRLSPAKRNVARSRPWLGCDPRARSIRKAAMPGWPMRSPPGQAWPPDPRSSSAGLALRIRPASRPHWR